MPFSDDIEFLVDFSDFYKDTPFDAADKFDPLTAILTGLNKVGGLVKQSADTNVQSLQELFAWIGG